MSDLKTHTYAARDESKTFPKIVVTYFDVTGRGEAIREALFIAGIPFDDRRVVFAQWPALKPTTKYGQMPFVQVDGKELAQTNAILMYVGDLTGLTPTDPWANAKVNEFLLLAEDTLRASFPTAYEKNPEKQAANRAELEKDLESRWLPYIDRQLQTTDKKFLLGDEITIADLALYEDYDWLINGFAKVSTAPWSKFPAIEKWQQNVKEAVQGWKDAHKANSSA